MAVLILHYVLVSVDGPAGPLAEQNKDLHSLFNIHTIEERILVYMFRIQLVLVGTIALVTSNSLLTTLARVVYYLHIIHCTQMTAVYLLNMYTNFGIFITEKSAQNAGPPEKS